ncbi:hypothetical protein ACOSQ3_013029 [Xanthoceras sorbifolium]
MLSPPTLPSDSKVCALKLADDSWNILLIREVFASSDTVAILSLPPSPSFFADRLIWNSDKYGFFTVKSAYWIAHHNSDDPSCYNNFESTAWWGFLWHLDVPSKIRLFI